VSNASRNGFAVEVSDAEDDLVVVSLAGELDLAGAPELAQALARIVDAGAGRVVVDLTRLAFLDSTGLRELIVAAKALQARDASLTLAGPRPNVQRLFDIVRLSETLAIAPSLEDAVDRSTA